MPNDINVKSTTNSRQIEKRKYEFDFDELKLYFREPYLIRMQNNKYIKIIQPSIGDILEIGDVEVYSRISPFVCNTTSCRVQLWDMGKDWNNITDYELFRMLVPTIRNVEFLFKIVYFIKNPNYNNEISETENIEYGNEKYLKVCEDVDFSKLEQYEKTNNDCDDIEGSKEIVLYDPDQEIIIDEETYMHIREYIRMMFNHYPKEEFAKGKLAKQWIIEEEKNNIKLENEKDTRRRKSVLLPLVSSLLNHPGFKYDLDGMKKLGIFAFMDSVQRLQIYEQCTAFMGGMYSGMMDISKLGQEELSKRLNWLQDIYRK